VSKIVFLLPLDAGSFNELFIIAKRFNELQFDVHFVITNRNHYVHDKKDTVEDSGFKFIDVSRLIDAALLSKLYKGKNRYFTIFMDLLVSIYNNLRIINNVKAMVSSDVSAIFLGSDRHPGWCTAFVKYGNKKNIPTVMIQYAIYAEEGELIRKYSLQDDYGYIHRVESFLNNLLSFLVKSNVILIE